jgi:hypothetical protein
VTAPVELDLDPHQSALVSQVAASGYFARVNEHEPKNAPGSGLTAALWVQSIRPYRSGLAATTVRVEWRLRLYTSMLMQPPDRIDPDLLRATTFLMAAYSFGFTLGGLVRSVDLLGEAGLPLQAQAGYLPIDKAMYRIMDITLPVIINDAFAQGA